MQKFKAIKCVDDWVCYDSNGGAWQYMRTSVPHLHHVVPSCNLEMARRELSDNCHTVDVIVIERGEMPSKDFLEDAADDLDSSDQDAAGHRHVANWLRKLAEVAGE